MNIFLKTLKLLPAGKGHSGGREGRWGKEQYFTILFLLGSCTRRLWRRTTGPDLKKKKKRLKFLLPSPASSWVCGMPRPSWAAKTPEPSTAREDQTGYGVGKRKTPIKQTFRSKWGVFHIACLSREGRNWCPSTGRGQRRANLPAGSPSPQCRWLLGFFLSKKWKYRCRGQCCPSAGSNRGERSCR